MEGLSPLDTRFLDPSGRLVSPGSVSPEDLIDMGSLLKQQRAIAALCRTAASIQIFDAEKPHPSARNEEFLVVYSPVCRRMRQVRNAEFGVPQCVVDIWRAAMKALNSGRPESAGCLAGERTLWACPVMLKYDGESYPKLCLTATAFEAGGLFSPDKLAENAGATVEEMARLREQAVAVALSGEALGEVRGLLAALAEIYTRKFSSNYHLAVALYQAEKQKRTIQEQGAALAKAHQELDRAFTLTLPNSSLARTLQTTPEYRDRYDPRTGMLTVVEVIPNGVYRHVVNALRVAAELHDLGVMGLVGVNKDVIVQSLIFHDVGKVQPQLEPGQAVDPGVFEEGKRHAQRSAEIAHHFYHLNPMVCELVRYHHHTEDQLPADFPRYLLPMYRLLRLIDGLSAAITRREARVHIEVTGTRLRITEDSPHPAFRGTRALDLFTGKTEQC
ncbi:MAG: HD domain-containing protein [Actinobacteria bacterium]|nr:HD domain-containing protein [Actinomycetota bacterium]